MVHTIVQVSHHGGWEPGSRMDRFMKRNKKKEVALGSDLFAEYVIAHEWRGATKSEELDDDTFANIEVICEANRSMLIKYSVFVSVHTEVTVSIGDVDTDVLDNALQTHYKRVLESMEGKDARCKVYENKRCEWCGDVKSKWSCFERA